MARPVHTLIQLTDLHIDEAGGTRRDPADTRDVAARALAAVERSGLGPAALLFTGDLTEHGTDAEYRRFAGLVEPVAERLGVPVVVLPGNHDDRGALARVLLGTGPGDGPVDQVVRLGGLRIVALDSTVPGRGYGELRPDQMRRLRDELATPAPDGTVLAVHHSPLPSAHDLADAIRLRNPEALAEAIDGTDVRVVLAGHQHVTSAGVLAGVPVWTAGPVSSAFDGLPAAGDLRSITHPTITRIDLFDGAVVSTLLPFDAEEVQRVPAPVVQPRIAELRAALERA